MSRARAQARAERERIAAARSAERAEQVRRAGELRARRERRSTLWRRIRIWQHGPQFRRRRETWGVVVALMLLCLLGAYVLTRSVEVVLGTALILVIVAPVVVALVFDRSRQ